jgi:acyl carrier protein
VTEALSVSCNTLKIKFFPQDREFWREQVDDPQWKEYGEKIRCGFSHRRGTSNTMSSEFTEFSTDIEHELASLWQQVLNTDSLPRPSDDFFSLGGDSVAMILVELRIREEFSVDLPEGTMLSVSSLRELSQLIEKCR